MMRLRLLEERDLDAVRELRNRNRQWFFDDAEVSVEQQRKCFAGLASRATRFYVIEDDGVVVGTISVTERGRGFEIGNLVLDEAHRGRGLMGQAVADLTRTPGRYFAEVKPGNDASLRVFERAGFVPESLRVERIV
jgi:RimJ/RimL family protein N-acetyltransferase